MRLEMLYEGRLAKWGGVAAISALGAIGCYGDDKPQTPPAQKDPQTQTQANNDKELAKFIEQWEGRKNKVYLDTKKIPTIGVGFNLRRGDAKEKLAAMNIKIQDVIGGKELTDDQINILLAADVKTAKSYAAKIFKTFDKQPTDVQKILVDMAFNLGHTGLSKFKKMIAAVDSMNYNKAADEMLNSDWYKQVGNRSEHHVKAMRAIKPSR